MKIAGSACHSCCIPCSEGPGAGSHCSLAVVVCPSPIFLAIATMPAEMHVKLGILTDILEEILEEDNPVEARTLLAVQLPSRMSLGMPFPLCYTCGPVSSGECFFGVR